MGSFAPTYLRVRHGHLSTADLKKKNIKKTNKEEKHGGSFFMKKSPFGRDCMDFFFYFFVVNFFSFLIFLYIFLLVFFLHFSFCGTLGSLFCCEGLSLKKNN